MIKTYPDMVKGDKSYPYFSTRENNSDSIFSYRSQSRLNLRSKTLWKVNHDEFVSIFV